MPVTTGMKGEGFYDQHSSPQYAAISSVLPWLGDAIGRMDLSRAHAPVVVVDYACSEGRNSIAAMREIVTAGSSGRRDRSRPYTATCRQTISTSSSSTCRALPRGCHEQVYSSAVGGSMFQQLLPSQTVTIATTFNAIGYLEHRPRPISPATSSRWGRAAPGRA